MKKILWIIGIIVVIAIIAISSQSKKESVGEGKIIKIGIVAPLTGGAAAYGETLVKGVEMAYADLKDTKHTYELVIEDDGSNPATSASAAQKLVNIDKVQGLISVSSGTGNAVKPIATAGKVPHLCVCSDNRVGDGEYNFVNLVSPTVEIKAWLAEAQRIGAKTVAILAQIHPGFELLMTELIKYAPEYGVTIVHDERFDGNTKDFKTIIAKARATNPDLYLTGSYVPSLDIIVTDFNRANVTNIAGIGTFTTSSDLSIYEGKWFTDAGLQDISLKDRFEKEFPAIRFNARTVPYGYDSFNILVNAFESETDPANYIQNMREYDGKVGKITKNAIGNAFDSPAAIWMIRGGEVVIK